MDLQIKVAGVGVCRQRDHVSVHNPRSDKIFCNNCGDTVIYNGGKTCPCCGESVKKKREYKALKTVLNNSLNDYEHIVIAWVKKPTQNKIHVYQKWKAITYSIPLELLALYYETQEPVTIKEKENRVNWIESFFTNQQLKEMRNFGILSYIDKRVKGIGLF